MRRLSLLSFALVLTSSCASFPSGEPVRPVDLYGTVTRVDTVKHRIDLELDTVTRYTLQQEETSLKPDLNRHGTPSVRLYYDETATVWNGVQAGKIRIGDRIVVSGRVDKGHWQAYEISARTY
ncbi:MAG: hypothetical protein ACRD3J_23125 [Thermoanaerobaculia bacterium]